MMMSNSIEGRTEGLRCMEWQLEVLRQNPFEAKN